MTRIVHALREDHRRLVKKDSGYRGIIYIDEYSGRSEYFLQKIRRDPSGSSSWVNVESETDNFKPGNPMGYTGFIRQYENSLRKLVGENFFTEEGSRSPKRSYSIKINWPYEPEKKDAAEKEPERPETKARQKKFSSKIKPQILA